MHPSTQEHPKLPNPGNTPPRHIRKIGGIVAARLIAMQVVTTLRVHCNYTTGIPLLITQPVMVATQGILRNHVLPSTLVDSQSTVDTVSTVKMEETEPELVSQFEYYTSITDQLIHE
jgi:glycosyltransferase A (GT-A) superfamily protein (DUF2064 family)